MAINSSGQTQPIRDLTDWGLSWATTAGQSVNLSYTFNAALRYQQPGLLPLDYPYGNYPLTYNSAFNGTQQTATQTILGEWAKVANVTFSQTNSGTPKMVFFNANDVRANTGVIALTWNYLSSNNTILRAEVEPLVNTYSWQLNPTVGSQGYFVLLHEIGHALGLDHPGGNPMSYDNDVTLMSYVTGSVTNASSYAITPMMYDIAAMQFLYGANYNYNSGSSTYQLTGAATVQTIWDGGGVDTLSAQGQSAAALIDLRGGVDANQNPYWSRMGSQYIAIALDKNDVGNGGVVRIENAIGGNGDDTVYGNQTGNFFNTLGGNDLIYGDAGADVIDGSDGSDTVDYSLSNAAVTVDVGMIGQTSGGYAAGDSLHNVEHVTGSRFGDTLRGNAGVNALLGGAGNDTINGGGQGDWLDGGAGDNTIWYATSPSGVTVDLSLTSAQGGSGDAQGDYVFNFSALVGTAYGDVIYGNSSANYFNTLDGDDTIYGSAGADVIDGSGGRDTVTYAASAAAVSVNLATGVSTGGDAQGDSLHFVEQIIGSAFNDTLTGGAADMMLLGGDGNDRLQGGSGHDTLVGGVGADTLHGGGGFNTVTYETSASRVQVQLGSTAAQVDGDAQGDVISNIINLIGSGYNDWLTGTAGNNFLAGVGGDDTIFGDAGSDVIDGGMGVDELNYYFSTAGIDVDLSTTAPQSGGYAQGDSLYNIERLIGTGYNDRVTGSSGDNLIDTWNGNDTLEGGAGNDTINGGTGDDLFIFGDGSGQDTVIGFDGEGSAGGDVISILSDINGSGIVDWASLQGFIAYDGVNETATIDLGNSNSIFITLVAQAFSADNFIFA